MFVYINLIQKSIRFPLIYILENCMTDATWVEKAQGRYT